MNGLTCAEVKGLSIGLGNLLPAGAFKSLEQRKQQKKSVSPPPSSRIRLLSSLFSSSRGSVSASLQRQATGKVNFGTQPLLPSSSPPTSSAATKIHLKTCPASPLQSPASSVSLNHDQQPPKLHLQPPLSPFAHSSRSSRPSSTFNLPCLRSPTQAAAATSPNSSSNPASSVSLNHERQSPSSTELHSNRSPPQSLPPAASSSNGGPEQPSPSSNHRAP